MKVLNAARKIPNKATGVTERWGNLAVCEEGQKGDEMNSYGPCVGRRMGSGR